MLDSLQSHCQNQLSGFYPSLFDGSTLLLMAKSPVRTVHNPLYPKIGWWEMFQETPLRSQQHAKKQEKSYFWFLHARGVTKNHTHHFFHVSKHMSTWFPKIGCTSWFPVPYPICRCELTCSTRRYRSRWWQMPSHTIHQLMGYELRRRRSEKQRSPCGCVWK